jgi:transposase
MSDFIGMDDISIMPGHLVDRLRKARMSAHTSASSERVEVITRGARRRWRVAAKRAIVLESLAPGVLVSAICRQHGISSGQLSTWRREMREGKLGDSRPPFLHFAEAVVAEPPTTRPLPRLLPNGAADQQDGNVATLQKRQQARGRPADGGVIEIVLPNGVVVRVGGDVDQAALSRILAAAKSA